jgi:hypothetical protein
LAPPLLSAARPREHAASKRGNRKTLADSGYFVGLFNPKDNHHARCKSFFAQYAGLTVATWAVLTEVCAILGPTRQKAFLSWAALAQAIGQLRIESPPADAVGLDG